MKETEEYKNNIAKMTTEKQRLHSAVKNMEKDINDLKSEISTRYILLNHKYFVLLFLSHKCRTLKKQVKW